MSAFAFGKYEDYKIEVEPRDEVAFAYFLEQRERHEKPLYPPPSAFLHNPKSSALDVFAQLTKYIPPEWMSYFDSILPLKLVEKTFRYEQLPEEFSGLKILHITDTHLDGSPALVDRIKKEIEGLEVDIIFITGDIGGKRHGDPYQHIVTRQLADIVDAVDPTYPPFACLGGHDSGKVVKELESVGIYVLVNQTAWIKLPNATLRIVGLEDTSHFQPIPKEGIFGTRQPGEFSVVLAHTADVAHIASQHGIDLYLSGHTHGGQWCLPNGRPICNLLKRNKQCVRGTWRMDSMQGETPTGIGTSILPWRIFCTAEIPLITLKPC